MISHLKMFHLSLQYWNSSVTLTHCMLVDFAFCSMSAQVFLVPCAKFCNFFHVIPIPANWWFVADIMVWMLTVAIVHKSEVFQPNVLWLSIDRSIDLYLCLCFFGYPLIYILIIYIACACSSPTFLACDTACGHVAGSVCHRAFLAQVSAQADSELTCWWNIIENIQNTSRCCIIFIKFGTYHQILYSQIFSDIKYIK